MEATEMTISQMRSALRAAGRTKAERAEHVKREAGKRGVHWVFGGPEVWSKDEVENAVIRMACDPEYKP